MKKGVWLTIACIMFISTSVSSTYAELQFKGGPYWRIRYEYWRNISDVNNESLDNRNFFRIKTSLWGQADYNNDVSLYLKLTNENRAYVHWGGASALAGKSANKKSYHYDINELVFDNLYLDIKKLLGLPLGVRLGRQDFSASEYGEGFILQDGTPVDGSRTYYFNATKLAWQVNDKNALDFLFIKNKYTDDLLPVINKQDGEQILNDTDEVAYGLYYKNDAIKNLHWENYYIYKRESKRGTGSNAKPMFRQKTLLNTIGSFARYNISPFVLRGQIAYQFGQYGNNDRDGVGGYAFVDRVFKNFLFAPELSLGWIYLSGDEQGSNDNEAWDPLFSRAPWMSDLYCMSYDRESAYNYWTNLQMWRISSVFKLTDKLKLTLRYNFLRADERYLSATASYNLTTFSGAGKTRGHLPQLKMEYSLNKNISTYFQAEYFVPGDFYVKSADDALFLRAELQVKF